MAPHIVSYRRIMNSGTVGGTEVVKCVNFNGSDEYLHSEVTSSGMWDTLDAERIFEVYYSRPSKSGVQEQLWHYSANTSTFYASMALQANGRIRINWRRTGGYGWRRDYIISDDTEKHHLFFSCDPDNFNRFKFYEDGVELTAVASAYNLADLIGSANDYLDFGKRAGLTEYFTGKVAYYAFYENKGYYSTAAGMAPYYEQRDNLNARRASQPSVAGVAKPDQFWCANDIDDLSTEWIDSNASISLASNNLDATDIEDF
jgi:hypothetical protein